jgi:hypothetical protein
MTQLKRTNSRWEKDLRFGGVLFEDVESELRAIRATDTSTTTNVV